VVGGDTMVASVAGLGQITVTVGT
ncbi:MAG: hypothetical protein RLZZ200_1050, partial [Pseudomonadota bacterium]